MSTSEGLLPQQEGSKFKRFLKRFGRRPSDEQRRSGQVEGDGMEEGETMTSEDAQPFASGFGTGAGEPGASTKKNGSTRSRKGSKSGSGTTNTAITNGPTSKGRRSDSLAGRFFQSSPSAPPLPASTQIRNGSAVTPSNGKNLSVAPVLPISAAEGFGGSSGEGLANTLTIPPSPAPQLDGLPQHDPIHLMPSGVVGSAYEPNGVSSHHDMIDLADNSSLTAGGETANVGGEDRTQRSSYESSSSRRGLSSSDLGSMTGGIRGRDSLDNRTMDTGKSRASTKPTTLMSMEMPDNPHGSYTPMAQIAQHRHGETPTASTRVASSRSNNSEGYGTSIQFAPQVPLGRTVSGTIVQLPGSVEEVPYVNVPTLSRPHPSNNPIPTGIPADNASMVTLASSTAAASINGGATSSRGHSHAAPSLGGARSIGGSLMGERRNSYDTYASVKALPPLSRRGSDSSTRTGKSVAASATGRSSAQAMMTPGSTGFVVAGPGAPSDRISLHRTPSQKTIATQLSIPISSSNQAMATNTDGSATQYLASDMGTSSLPSITTTAPQQYQSIEHQVETSEAISNHVDQLAAS